MFKGVVVNLVSRIFESVAEFEQEVSYNDFETLQWLNPELRQYRN